MKAPIWIIVFEPSGKQLAIVRCSWEGQAADTIFHNHYYGYRCLKVTVKAWR